MPELQLPGFPYPLRGRLPLAASLPFTKLTPQFSRPGTLVMDISNKTSRVNLPRSLLGGVKVK